MKLLQLHNGLICGGDVVQSLLQMKIFDLQEDISLKMQQTASLEQFWVKESQISGKMSKLTINLSSIFGFICVDNKTFSKIIFLFKNQYRLRFR